MERGNGDRHFSSPVPGVRSLIDAGLPASDEGVDQNAKQGLH